MSPFTYLKRRINMKDIDDMFKDILEDNNKEDIFEDNSWIALIIILALLGNNKIDNDQPIINIYLGDE